jgi:Flp pilus assembly CpaE family ATPase
LLAADRIIVPVTPDIPSVRAALYFVQMARESGIGDRLLIVPNRANSGVAVGDIERVLGLPAFCRIRSAGMLFINAANAGRALVEQYPQSKVAADLEGLTDKLMALVGSASGRVALPEASWLALGRKILGRKAGYGAAVR